MISQFPTFNRISSITIGFITVAVAAIMIFAHLGHYALWDDEALDALNARGIRLTGQPTAILGNNIVAYRGGLLLVNLRPQAMPPLPAYLVADSFLIFGENSWSARFPFAVCGFLCIGLMTYWGLRLRMHWSVQLILALAILGNVSFILYFRNCHYYGIGIFANVAIAYIYLYHLKSRVGQLIIALISGILMMSNYSWFIILYACLLADYLIWRRKEYSLNIQDLCRIFLPQIPFGLLLIWRFNPMETALGGYLTHNTFSQHLLLLLWNIRDINCCEFLPFGLILIALIFWRHLDSQWLRRGLLALSIYIVVVSAISTQLVSITTVADIRYMAAVLPLCIAISTLIIVGICRYSLGGGILIALLAFGTNLFNGGPLLPEGFRSTAYAYTQELLHPPGDPYSVASKWINENVPKGSSIWVLPEYMTYPLMFHAPRFVYAWQLEWPPKPQFANLNRIHFRGVIPPDYIVAFGPVVENVRHAVNQWEQKGVKYVETKRLDYFWKDLYRPELLWRVFKPIENYDKNEEAIYVFERITPPQGTNFSRSQ